MSMRTLRVADAALIETKMKALKSVGVPYSEEDIAKSREDLKDKTEADALIDYLQGLGTALKGVK